MMNAAANNAPVSEAAKSGQIPQESVAGQSVGDEFAFTQPEPEEDLYVWKAPNRPFKKRNREFFTTVFLIVFLVSLILFFANQFLPIAVVMALGFLTYVLASVPPDMIENKITTYGLHSGEHMVYWFEMGRFWFTKKFGLYIMHVETSRFPFRVMMLFSEGEKAHVEQHMKQYLLEESPKPTMIDKAADWLQEKIPLDRETQQTASKSSAKTQNPKTATSTK